ncbi:Precorrin-6A reductase [uncultured Gammaproteobacteria bacterium]
MINRKHVLVLGGTSEALELAAVLAGREDVKLISSLAGRTLAHRLPPGSVRVGGFGGADGLARYLRDEAISVVIDATHPFAATISHHARIACTETGIARVQVVRPPWTPEAGDRWQEVADMAAAAAALPGLSRRAFLAIGRLELGAFAGLAGVRLFPRMVDAPTKPPSLIDFELILARGPFSVADERALFERHGIDALVSKNSGGEATAAKLTAARQLGLPVIMVRRPPPAPTHPTESRGVVDSVAAALAWLDQ